MRKSFTARYILLLGAKGSLRTTRTDGDITTMSKDARNTDEFVRLFSLYAKNIYFVHHDSGP